MKGQRSLHIHFFAIHVYKFFVDFTDCFPLWLSRQNAAQDGGHGMGGKGGGGGGGVKVGNSD